MSKSPNKTRELTILRKHRPIEDGRCYTHDPDLRLCGKWLRETGFRSGQIVAVKCYDRKLIIEPIREPDEQPQTYRSAAPVYSRQHQAAKAQLMHKFQTWGCTYAAEEPLETGGTRFCIIAPNGHWYFIHLHLLDLDKSDSIKILQSELDYEVSNKKCILLALYRRNTEPRCYLVPPWIFYKPGSDTFILNNVQPPQGHLSNWEIRVSRSNASVLACHALELAQGLEWNIATKTFYAFRKG